jgi:medium-chain acyl-[acyl-carrier-protein] hydrolase
MTPESRPLQESQASIAPTRWLMYQKSRPQARLRLFCFPYAGGGALMFRDWHTELPPTVEVYPVQLPGHGNRMREQPFTDLFQLVEAAAKELLPYFDKPFAFFGHSMGAIISFELSRLLRRMNGPLPRHLFISGSRAPQIPDPRPPTYNLPDSEFLQRLEELKGTPVEVLENAELLQLILPVVRADLTMCQTYDYLEEPPLSISITAYGGLQDEEVSRAFLEAWQAQTTVFFKTRMLPGDHFFLNTVRQLFLHTLIQDLIGLV